MSYEIDSKPKKLVALATEGRVYLWTEDYDARRNQGVGVAINTGDESSVVASLAAAGATEDTVELSYDQFFELIEYVLTNEHLRQEDPRSNFLNRLRNVRTVKGWGGIGERLEI
ncbi:MAG: hypothetical protein AABW93_01465 [Nanoarchaeota archaeon]